MIRMNPIQRQAQRCINGLERMLRRAETTGRRVNGYTADELRQSIADYGVIILTGVVPPVPQPDTCIQSDADGID